VSVTLHERLSTFELHWWWERPEAGEVIAFHDHLAARAFLGRLGARSDHTAALRRFVSGHLQPARLDDPSFFDQLSFWLASGRMRVAAARVARLAGREGKIEALQDVVPWDAPAPRDDAPIAPAAESPLDEAAQAAVLRSAAKQGVPFCAECEKARKKREAEQQLDSAAQAEALKEAAKDGVPFCEECEKAKAKAKAEAEAKAG
jgi:hypothetical protein